MAWDESGIQLYADWCKRYDIRPKTAVAFGRDLAPYILKEWVGTCRIGSAWGKCIYLRKVRESRFKGRQISTSNGITSYNTKIREFVAKR
jgi:hypothetical protein